MVSQSEKSRIQAMISSLSKILAGENSTALAVSSKNDELDILARTINALLQKNERSVSPPSGHDETRMAVSNENEKHSLQILDRMQESYFETDLWGNFIFFNDRLLKALGYTAAEFRGMNFRKILAPEHIRKTYKTFRNLFLTGEPVHGFEWRIVKKDGVKMDIETSAALLYGPDGKPAGFYGISHNITQRKQTDRQLKASEERYRDIVYSIEESYFETDLNGNLLFVNDSSPRDLQYSLEELQSKNFRIFTDEENAKKVYNAFHQVYLTGAPVKALEWKIFRKDGYVLDVESSVTLMRDDEGRPCGFRGITRDVSQRKETEKRLRLITENIRDVIWTRDFDLNLTYISPSIYRMTGFTTEEVLADQTGHFSISADLNSLKQQLEEKLAYGKAHPFEKSGPMSLETQIKRKDGVIIWVEVNASFNRDERGMPFEIIGVTREITERKKAEEIFKESEKLHRMIIENMQDSIMLLDFNLDYIYQSPSEVRLTGWTAEEVRNIPIKDQLTPESYAMAEKILVEEIERELSGESTDLHRQRVMEVEAYTKDGRTIWQEVTSSFYRDETGKAIGILLAARDVTERKKAQQAFAESEKRYRMIVENMHDSIATLDMNFRPTYVSPSEIHTSGYTAEEAMQLQPGQLLTPQSREFVRKVIADEFEKEFSGRPVDPHRVVTMEMEIYHKNGSTAWNEVQASFNRDENSKPVGIMLVSRDITERKKMEGILRESEKRYRMIVENMHDTIWTMDMDLHYTYQSPSEIRVTGYTPEEIMHIPIDKMLTPESFAQVSQMFAQELEKEFSGEPVDPTRSRTIELEMHHKKGHTIWQEISASFNRDENGKPVEIMLVGRDITERKKMEEALKESEKRYRMIVENMQDTISILDMNLNYVYQSPSEIRITGYTPEEIVKIPIERQVTPESLEKGLNILFEELGKEFSDTPVDPHRSIVFEVESYRKGGGSVWLEETCTFQRDESGKPVGILLAGRNITERKKAEQERDKLAAQLLHSQKMETVGRLAGGVAHDFNNMLNVILGYIDLAKMRLTMENPVYSDLIEIEKAATRSRDLTAQLLAFSRKQIISPKVVNLNELVAETQKTITRLIGEDIDLKFYPAENLWPIKFDPIQVEQILINLAVNARDAMYKGGKLIIETANISADGHFCDAHIDVAPGDYIQLSVSDTGVGIAKASLPHVFEPFFTTKEFGKGTGLGLSTVYGIVKQNNGFISVYSEPGQGSTFKIYIPRTGEALNITARLPEKPAKSGSGTILLVEDDEMVLKMVSDMLEALGYMVIASENPQDALSLCEKGVTPIDLVITDVVMPQMSGKELRDKLIARSTDMKILFMSGYTSNIIAQHGVLEEGMQFIQKPFSINMLSEKVKQMIAVK